jgi:hypothetical protein
MKYEVVVIETKGHILKVEADSKDQIREMYREGEISGENGDCVYSDCYINEIKQL